MKNLIGKIAAWLAIAAAIVGLLYQIEILGIVAIVIGIIGYFLKADIKKMSLTAAAMGVIVYLVSNISYI